MSTILQEIALTFGDKEPTTYQEAFALVRKARNQSSPQIWTRWRTETQEYLSECQEALRSQNPKIPMPSDFIEQEPVEDPKAAEENEPLPEGFTCSDPAVFVQEVDGLLTQEAQGRIKLPDFQRKFRWKKITQELFLDSIFCGMPIPNVLLAVDPDTSPRFVLDGYQRLSTLKGFKNNEIPLGNQSQYGNKRFNELPEYLQERFLHRKITVIESTVSRKWWSFIFRRINKGSAPLNPMELRRAVYEDSELLFQLSQLTEKHDQWFTIFGKSTCYKGLQSLLRATALHSRYSGYQKPMDQFLDNFCELPELAGITAEELHIKLAYIIQALAMVVNKQAFRTAPSKPVNLGLVDSMIHAGLLLIEQETILEDPVLLGRKLASVRNLLLADPEFLRALSTDTSGKDSVQVRMSKVEGLINAPIIAFRDRLIN